MSGRHAEMPASVDMDENAALYFQREVLKWAHTNGRDFPWRGTSDPYLILVAELMLRRTQAKQVVQVYERFTLRFPDLVSLAKADEDEVIELLQPLGLSWRTPAFRQMALKIVDDHRGQVPDNLDFLRSLPGVGDYVASAVLSFAWNRPIAVVDTNTVRVAGRYFGFETNAESRRRNGVKQSVLQLIDPAQSRASNYALLDFAAKVCTARRPRCEACWVASRCKWNSKKKF